jgi:hypothetical protein
LERHTASWHSGHGACAAQRFGVGYPHRFATGDYTALLSGKNNTTGVGNLLIDVVAQSGRYPPGETDPKKFIVEGEQHYWVHVAIDRFTGQVIDRQVEVVKE